VVMAQSKARIKIPSGGILHESRVIAAYNGASTKTRMGTKGLGSRGPNGSRDQKANLVSRARHTIINNPYAVTAQRTYVDNVIGTGITPQWPTDELQNLWDKWVLECDADDQHLSFSGLQALVANTEFSDGEVLTRFRWRDKSDGLTVPLQLEVLEGDHLPELKDDPTQNIFSGIQKDDSGRRTHYYLHPYHPKDIVSLVSNQLEMVDADDVIHLFDKVRPKQDRGYPKLSVILVRLYEIDEIQDATLAKQKTAALFGAFITRGDDEDYDEDDIGEDETIVGEDSGEDEHGAQINEIRAGALHYLEKGEKVEFSSPEGVGSNYVEWLKTELRASAKAVGMTYEQFTGDLTGVNFSSLRAGLNEFRKRIERVQYHVFIHQFCHRVAAKFLDVVFLNRLAQLPKFLEDKHQYFPTWQTPKLYMVNPLQDAMTDLIEVRSGFASRRQKQAERGHSPEQITKQIMKEQGVDDPNDLILDSNPSTVNKSGTLQQGIDLVNSLDNSE